MNFRSFFNPNYIFSAASGTTYEPWYLYLSLALIISPILFYAFFKFSKRIAAYKAFDRYLIWGYLTLGLIGLFFWFSRNQGLPTFSIRLFSYLWLISIVGYDFFLLYYYKKRIPASITKHYEKTRKEKYLK